MVYSLGFIWAAAASPNHLATSRTALKPPGKPDSGIRTLLLHELGNIVIFRLKARNFRYFENSAIVFHKHKATAKKFPQLVEYWQFRNMTQTIIKDFPKRILLKDFRLIKIILVHVKDYIH